MPSIRRSLLGYLLLLLAIALGGVGLLIDRFAQAAMSAREDSATMRIEQAYQLREKEALTQLDADLLSDAHGLWEAVRPRLFNLQPMPDSPPVSPLVAAVRA